jgi:hypothetical protein
MIQSETIGKLAEALSKAQAAIENAKKESNNPYFKSKYADLASIWEACRKPLTDNGLSIVQSPVFLTEHPDMVGLDTRLCHASGEWLEGRIVMKPVKSDPQSYGSCLTYLRRYSLQSFISVCAEEDDDGNAATQPNTAAGKKVDTKPKATTRQPDDIPEATGRPPDEVPPQGNVARNEGIEVGYVRIANVSAKEGETKGKKWKAFFIKTVTGEDYGTFSESLAALASTYQKTGELVGISWKKGKKPGSKELVGIEEKKEPAAVPDPAATDFAPAPAPCPQPGNNLSPKILRGMPEVCRMSGLFLSGRRET